MSKKYLQLTYEDRRLISHWKARGLNITQIALRMGVHKSTVSRELRRNGRVITRQDQLFYLELSLLGFPKQELRNYLIKLKACPEKLQDANSWSATQAQKSREYRVHCTNQLRRRKMTLTRTWVIQKLKTHWSPKQIAGRSVFEAPEPVSYEYVYRLIYEDKKRGGSLHRLLKRYRKRKQRFGSRSYPSGPRIPNRIGIEQRPKIVESRSRLGDLEGDLIQGYCNSGYVLSVIDRKSRLLVLRKLKTKRKRGVRVQLERAIRKMKHAKTLTLDNGTEFCDHQELTRTTKVPVYFATPYRSTERGSNENANGLVRYFLPKKTCFKNLTQTRLNKIQDLLNHRPRACLSYLTPWEIHFKKYPKISHNKPLHLRSNSAQILLFKIPLPLASDCEKPWSREAALLPSETEPRARRKPEKRQKKDRPPL
jgi:transposase, IS30 family